MSFELRPGHVIKFLLFISWMRIDFFGQPVAACRQLSSSYFFLSRRNMEFLCWVMVLVRGGSGYEVSIVTTHKPYNVLLISLSTGFLSELKMVTSLLWTARSNLNHTVFLLREGWCSLSLDMHDIVWLLMVTLGEVYIQKVLVWIIELLGRRTLGPVAVGPGLFKIMVSCPLI